MAQQSASSSTVIRRLRSGTTVSMELSCRQSTTQVVDRSTGAVTPDWSTGEDQPVITPSPTSTRGTVTIVSGTWEYNGITLSFSGTSDSEGYAACTTSGCEGLFMFNGATFALKITGNLASVDNYASDTLTFTATCRVEGTEYTLSKSKTIEIVEGTASSYTGDVWGGNVFDEGSDELTLYARLIGGLAYLTNFTVRIYKDSKDNFLTELSSGSDDTVSYTITRDSVDFVNIFIFEFRLDGTAVAQKIYYVLDDGDDYRIEFTTTSEAKEITVDQGVTVKAYLWKSSANGGEGDYADPSGKASWTTYVMSQDMTTSRSASGDTITVDYDDCGENHDSDVIVTAQATWDTGALE